MVYGCVYVLGVMYGYSLYIHVHVYMYNVWCMGVCMY